MNEQDNQMTRLLSALLPDETVSGDPYWALMQWNHNHLTGALWMIPYQDHHVIPLFTSREQAEQIRHTIKEPEQYVVRGLSRTHLHFVVRTASEGIHFAVVDEIFANGQFALTLMTTQNLLARDV
ncbi:hypothetical protein [Sulfobacillus thermosulfidooxidans]|uniref:hypothetical protein n=1 Tax=Sulfobacillus thermosulfidooxidans TaxID=28034 RepID=UPI0006B69391|nr:hypothetical protein [Sulfobacillus thermosulfidooxidans]